jgi:hypothetical protein
MKKLIALFLLLSSVACKSQYYLPATNFYQYIATNVPTIAPNTTVSNLTIIGTATATNIKSGTVYTTNLNAYNVFGTNQITSFGTLNCNGGGAVNAAGDINVSGIIDMNGAGAGKYFYLASSGNIRIHNNFSYNVGSWDANNFVLNPPSASGSINLSYANGTGGVIFGNGSSGAAGSISSSGNFTNAGSIDSAKGITAWGNVTNKGGYYGSGPIITSSPISCNVVTNNGMIWYSYATNANPSFLTGPSGSICTTTNGQLFVRSNTVWLLK